MVWKENVLYPGDRDHQAHHKGDTAVVLFCFVFYSKQNISITLSHTSVYSLQLSVGKAGGCVS